MYNACIFRDVRFPNTKYKMLDVCEIRFDSRIGKTIKEIADRQREKERKRD